MTKSATFGLLNEQESSIKLANSRILTINGGSSSIKFARFEAGDPLQRMSSLLDQKTHRVWAILRLAVNKFLRIDGAQWASAFACHAYPWLIHRLTYRRTNHDNILVRGYKEGGTITTPFDMTVLNDLDRFHLVMDTVDRLPQTGDKGIYLKRQLKDNLVEHKQYIVRHGQDMPEIRNWNWKWIRD